jgi:hypothetical protein
MDAIKYTNGWNEWAHRVLGDLERLEDQQKEIFNTLKCIAVDIAVLKTKAALIGGVWGAVVSAVISIVVMFIFKGIK